MSIWFKPYRLTEIASMTEKYLVSHLDIHFTEIGDDFLQATMPVNEQTWMPARLLHGGASCVLAETVGSVASVMVIDPAKFRPVGLEINASHLRAVQSGDVLGTARPLRLGRKTHVWDIQITDQEQRLVCVSRLTMAIIEAD